MIHHVNVLLPLASVCTVVASLALYAVFFLALRKFKRDHEQHIKKLESTIKVLSSGSLGMGQKMLALEAQIVRLRDAQEEMKLSDIDFSYVQAQKLISQGVDDDAVAANSGLSSTEINLMRLLHRQEVKIADHA